jgi:hypothetical protein
MIRGYSSNRPQASEIAAMVFVAGPHSSSFVASSVNLSQNGQEKPLQSQMFSHSPVLQINAPSKERCYMMVRPCLQLRGRNVGQKQPSRIDLVSQKERSLLLDVVIVHISQAHLLSDVLKIIHFIS